MNILPLVLTVLMILAYSGTALFQKHMASRRSQSAYIGLRKVERSLLRKSEQKTFREQEGVLVKPAKKEGLASVQKTKAPFVPPAINPSCSRLNLFPLIEEGKEVHRARYELAAKLLRLFYQKKFFGDVKRAEYHLLDSLLESAKLAMKEKDSLPLETIALTDETLQPLYYLLLKGTKHPNVFAEVGTPCLGDFFKIERADSPICLFHAHPHMLAPFFGVKKTPELYQKLHEEVSGGLEVEALLMLANDPELAFIDPTTWDLLDLHKPKHSSLLYEVLLAEDAASGISIRQNLPKKS